MDTIDPIDLANWAGGEWKLGIPGEIVGLTNDSRKAEEGQLFAALKTSARDGHEFVGAAQQKGAAGAIVERVLEEVDLPQLRVPDVNAALLRMAKGYRSSWQAEVVGITGSCGKTTCKELLACLLSGEPTLSTLGNLNNLIGVPMSVLRPEGAAARFAVLEAGISEPGEMEQLARVVDPEWGVVTAIGPSHLQDLGTVENVALEKGKLLQGGRLKRAFVGETAEPYLSQLGCEGACVVKPDSSLSADWSYRVESIGSRSRLSQRLEGVVETFEYEGTGAGLASNAALAIAVAYSMGISVERLREALRFWKPSQMRNEWRDVEGHSVFLDCYNANPISMKDSLATFVTQTPEDQPRLFLVGCMEELGAEAGRLHEELGRYFPLRKEDLLLVIGGEASSVLRGMKSAGRELGNCFEITEIEEARDYFEGFVGSVFLKGSRRYRLESSLAFIKGGAVC
ncbi:UDP-N-acetylmuramoyl-tripeptide--D-alanyl-D-alanine ligase [Pelagicoccus mobilis]|uniref:UDP-N-acetylmuramoyl-tripeptide--D-alanyl-D-alanine ligase n=1 Tax=Pelagicoccus mobilis TaxID=415221 RepID=A0A934RWN7_9BACT|nr:Mur ligase family protein [Pelagicoccus mobilis]MBK1876584.1 hypothetical protein [Pelagicoccus mobilis]